MAIFKTFVKNRLESEYHAAFEQLLANRYSDDRVVVDGYLNRFGHTSARGEYHSYTHRINTKVIS